jgi:hypothetical protein
MSQYCSPRFLPPINCNASATALQSAGAGMSLVSMCRRFSPWTRPAAALAVCGLVGISADLGLCRPVVVVPPLEQAADGAAQVPAGVLVGRGGQQCAHAVAGQLCGQYRPAARDHPHVDAVALVHAVPRRPAGGSGPPATPHRAGPRCARPRRTRLRQARRLSRMPWPRLWHACALRSRTCVPQSR